MHEVTGDELRRMAAYILRAEARTGEAEFYQYSKGLRVDFFGAQMYRNFKV